jgi:hypothetical protein
MTPTLDAVATEPDLAREVSRDTLIRVMMACALALMGEPHPAAAMDRAISDTLSSEEAARLIGIAPRTLARGARGTYHALLLPTGTRRLAFSRRAIEAWQQSRAGSPGAELSDQPQERKRGMSPAARSPYPWLDSRRGGRS